jgi:hypothetical protein
MFARVPPRNESLVPIVFPSTGGGMMDGADEERDDVEDLLPSTRIAVAR